MGLGFSVMNESVGIEKKVGVFGTYAYRLQVNDDAHLSFGLNAGIINLRQNFLEVIEHDQGDPQFSENVQSVVPNAGFGIYFNTKKAYAGISIPRMIDNYLDAEDGLQFKNQLDMQSLHYYLTGGYVFDLSSNVKLKPMTMIKASDGAPVQMDFSIAAQFKEIFWIGATVRSGDAVAVFTQINITKQLRLGYSFDYTLTKLNDYGHGSHEISLGYDIPLQKTGVLSPRYF